MICKDCGKEFLKKRGKQSRCYECQFKYNRHRRNELTKNSNRMKKGTIIKLLPDGYLYLRDWAKSQGLSVRKAQKIIFKNPSQYNAKKVSNPHGGVDVWAIPQNALFHKPLKSTNHIKPPKQIKRKNIELTAKPEKKVKKCIAPDCDRFAVAKGYCSKHYQQIYFRGQLISKNKIRKKCSVEGCNNPCRSKGLCNKHYIQYWRKVRKQDKK